MTTITPKENNSKVYRSKFLTGIILAMSLMAFYACENGSGTRSQAKEATSHGPYDISANITAPTNGAFITLDSTVSADVEFVVVAQGGTGDYSYTWVVEGPRATSTSTSTDQSTTLTFFDTGNHKITVTVTDDNGITGQDTIYIELVGPTYGTITNLKAIITSPIITEYGVGTTVAFSGTAQGGSAPYSYAWVWTGPFANIVPSTSTAQSPNFQFLAPGTYVVTFTVKDNMAFTATDTLTVQIK